MWMFSDIIYFHLQYHCLMIGCQYDHSERCTLLLSVELITSLMAEYDVWYSDVDAYQQLQATQMNVEQLWSSILRFGRTASFFRL